MDWFYPKRRGPEWKQGWTSRTLSATSAPPVHLVAVFGIVVALMWLSQRTEARVQQASVNFQVSLLLMPLGLILLMAWYSTSRWAGFRVRSAQPESSILDRAPPGSSPWGVAVFVVLLLVLLWYQSSFHSKWFGPLRSVN